MVGRATDTTVWSMRIIDSDRVIVPQIHHLRLLSVIHRTRRRPYPAPQFRASGRTWPPVLAAGALTLLAFALRFLAARQGLGGRRAVLAPGRVPAPLRTPLACARSCHHRDRRIPWGSGSPPPHLGHLGEELDHRLASLQHRRRFQPILA